MQLNRLNDYDLERLELVKYPTKEMLDALILKLREINDLNDKLKLKLDGIEDSLMEAEIEL